MRHRCGFFSCALGVAATICCTDAGATDVSRLPEHPFWERPIPAQGPAPRVPPGAEAVADLSATACGLCHAPQFTAWRASLHAAALSPGVLGQLDAFDRATQDDCLACHAPREEMLEQWREAGLDGAAAMAGVDCPTCHVRRHVRHGPRALAETPHGAVESLSLYRQAEFCAPCHQFDETGLAVNGKPLENTYTEWQESRYARQGVTCQACHMPAKLHAFKGIHDREITRRGLAVRAWRVRDGLRVLVGNRGAGHALPTYVTPRILVRLQGTGGAPSRVHAIARTMRWSLEDGWEEVADDRLFPDRWLALELPLPPDRAGQVNVRVEPDYDYHARVYPALLRMLKDSLSEEERSLLERARDEASKTAYNLYRFGCPPWNGQGERCAEQP